MPLIGGIRPPIAALLALLLLVAGGTAVSLGRQENRDVPKAVLASQQHVAEDGATALRASLDESTTDLRRAAAMFNAGRPATPDTVLTSLARVYQKWRGTAIVDLRSGRLLAAHGENVPLAAIDSGNLPDGLPPKLVTLKTGETRLLVFAVLAWPGRQELLVASDSLQVPSITTGDDRALQVISSKGTILAADGPGAGSKAAKALALNAARRLHGSRPSDSAGAGGFAGPSGKLLGGVKDGRRTVAGFASVTPGSGATDNSLAGTLGLGVVTSVQVVQDPSSTSHQLFGILAAGVLLALAAIVTFVLFRTLQKPLLRLHIEARRLTRGDLTRPVTVPRFGEPARIGTSLESLRKQLLGAAPGGRAVARRQDDRTGLRTVLVICAVVLLSWAAPLLFLLNRGDHTAVVPQQLVTDQRQRTETAANRVRQGLNEGYVDLKSVALSVSGADPRQMHRLLDTTLAEHGRYRNLYVVDGHGRIIARGGKDPRTPESARTHDGVELVNHAGREPVIVAVAEVQGGPERYVAGEFEIPFLNGILSRPGLGKIWLVDEHRHLVASNRGFRAFTPLPDERVRDAVETAADTHTPTGLLLRSGDPAVAAAVPFRKAGPAGHLKWQVASEQPASWMALPAYEAQRHTMLAGLLGLATATTCLGWLHIIVVRPLRALADEAENLASGDRKTVLYPRHHDEVGSVVRSLELIRQQLTGQGGGSSGRGSGGRGGARPGRGRAAAGGSGAARSNLAGSGAAGSGAAGSSAAGSDGDGSDGAVARPGLPRRRPGGAAADPAQPLGRRN
jgi:HAMP domain-containing protein